MTDLKKKAEQRLAQIKKTFSAQLEDKLTIISNLEEAKSDLEEKLDETKEEMQNIKDNLSSNEEMENKVKEDAALRKVSFVLKLFILIYLWLNNISRNWRLKSLNWKFS